MVTCAGYKQTPESFKVAPYIDPVRTSLDWGFWDGSVGGVGQRGLDLVYAAQSGCLSSAVSAQPQVGDGHLATVLRCRGRRAWRIRNTFLHERLLDGRNDRRDILNPKENSQKRGIVYAFCRNFPNC